MDDREIQKLACELVDFIEERLQSHPEMLRMRQAPNYRCPSGFDCGRYREKGCKMSDHSCEGGFSCSSYDVKAL